METKQLIEATCPDCRGPLSEIRLDDLSQYRCLVGHLYSARSLLQAHGEAQEKALWSAVVALEESANIIQAVAPELPLILVERLREQVEKKLAQASEIKKILEQLEPFQTD